MRSTFALAVALLVCAGSAQAAETPADTAEAPATVLRDVAFAATPEATEYRFIANGSLAGRTVEASTEGAVLNLRVDGISTARQWVTTPDADIMRTLLHPAGNPASVVRIRFHQPVSEAVVAAIESSVEDGVLVARVPRTAEIAATWAARGNASSATSTRPAAPPPPVVALAPTAEAPVPAFAEPLAPTAEVAAPVAETAATAPTDKPLTGSDKPLTLGEEEPAAAGLTPATAQSEGPSVGMIAMSLMLLGAAGLFLWKKARGTRAGVRDERLIKPLSTHFVGPKQGIMLVEVAGEMVLLGTSDKGVQMLTKIEPRNEHSLLARLPAADPAELAGFTRTPTRSVPVAPLSAPLPLDEESPVSTKLAAQLARIRKAPAPVVVNDRELDEIEKNFFEDAGAEAQPELPANVSRMSRTRPAAPARRPVAAAPKAQLTPTPSPVQQQRAEDDALTADIMKKIRQLQGA